MQAIRGDDNELEAATLGARLLFTPPRRFHDPFVVRAGGHDPHKGAASQNAVTFPTVGQLRVNTTPTTWLDVYWRQGILGEVMHVAGLW